LAATLGRPVKGTAAGEARSCTSASTERGFDEARLAGAPHESESRAQCCARGCKIPVLVPVRASPVPSVVLL